MGVQNQCPDWNYVTQAYQNDRRMKVIRI